MSTDTCTASYRPSLLVGSNICGSPTSLASTEAFYGRAQFYIATGHDKEFRKMLALVPARAELVTALELGQP